MTENIEHTEEEMEILTEIYNTPMEDPFSEAPERVKRAFKKLIDHMGIKTRDEAWDRIDHLGIVFLHLHVVLGEVFPSFFSVEQTRDVMFDYAFGESEAIYGSDASRFRASLESTLAKPSSAQLLLSFPEDDHD